MQDVRLQRFNEEEYQESKKEHKQEEEITMSGDLGSLLPAKDRITRVL